MYYLWARQDLNLHSSDYESATFTIKLRAHYIKNINNANIIKKFETKKYF